ncbi:hypothetical protein LINPERHAP1_LOCUS24110 [Linum perenne]
MNDDDHYAPLVLMLWRILSLVLFPNLVNRLPQQVNEISISIPIPHLPIQFHNKPFLNLLTILQKPTSNTISFVPPIPIPTSHLLTRPVTSIHPHELSDPTHQPFRRFPSSVPLPYARHLVVHYPHELPPYVPLVAP